MEQIIPETRQTWTVADAVIAVLAGLGAAVVAGVALGTAEPSTLQVFGVIVPAQTLTTIGMIYALAVRRGMAPAPALGLAFRPVDLLGFAHGFGIQIGLGMIVLLLTEVFGIDFETQQVVQEAEEAASSIDRALVVLGAGILAPVAEELAFRGVALRALLARTGAVAAVVWSSAAWALLHLLDPNAGLLVPLFFAMGLVLGGITVRSGRITQALLAHITFNMISVVALLACEGGSC